ncbi:MAG: oxygenase MpaB family protein [Solirubrobacterales bacterium]
MRPGSIAWRIGAEGLLLLGGARALILQVAHPAVAAGVAQHSNYRQAPWRRLYRTLEVTTRIVFGDERSSAEAAGALRRVHERIEGRDDRGRRYRATDPELLLWVHATLIDTSLLIYDRYVRRLSERERAVYYEQMMPVAEAYGIPRERQPPDWPAFRSYRDEMLSGGLRVTGTTRDVADSILAPELPLPARPPAWPALEAIRLVTVGTLPEPLRAELGLPWGPLRERLLAASQGTIRRALPLLPSLVRRLPAARRAA